MVGEGGDAQDRSMPITTSWQCGCGTPVAAGDCPQCGWAQTQPGQPDRTPHRWAAAVGGLITTTLAVSCVALLMGAGQPSTVRFERVGQAIGEPAPDLADVPNRQLPVDLASLFPAPLEGTQVLQLPGFSGAMDLATASSLGQGNDLGKAMERRRLEKSGFRRGNGIVFGRPANGEITGVIFYELESVAAAEDYLDAQLALVKRTPQATVVDLPYVEAEVAWSYPVKDGEGMDVLYRIDQMIVREYVAHPTSPVATGDLAPLHAAVTAGLGA
jgi:hypothetical protein